MPCRPNEAASNAILDSGLDFFDGATITLYTGTQPTAGGGSHSDTELASGTLPDPDAFAAASGRGRAPNGWTVTGVAAGEAGWARVTQGSAIIDWDVGEGSGSLSLDDTTIAVSDEVEISAGTGVILPGNDGA